ncbi:hypothetical protein SLEP1_g9395 [Rubroshorea leprosula]|uniref:Uncharacterized protein n=1 Tax=Rubroshorea leprosula TaxID=152421 RepID=A0AAV5IAQ8_9ROSI|nr:hypothetical protein SLEP1_g9395 [Rubroshorea leprosula]
MDSHTSRTQASLHKTLLEYSARTQRLNEQTISYLHQLTKDNEHLRKANEHLRKANEQLERQLQDMTIDCHYHGRCALSTLSLEAKEPNSSLVPTTPAPSVPIPSSTITSGSRAKPPFDIVVLGCTPRKWHLMLMMRGCSFISLQIITKKSNETFKEFAQRWRSKAAKLQLQYTSAFKPTTYPQKRPNFNTQALTKQQFPSTNRARQFTKLPIPYNEYKIQDLIDEGKLQLDAKEVESTPNITRNPLPLHDVGTMNMVALDEVEKLVLENASFWSLDELFAILIKYDLIQPIVQMSLNVSRVTIDDALFKEVAVDDIIDEVYSDHEEDYFGFNNLFGPANMTDSRERWKRMLVERASIENHPSFHLVHHVKAPMGSHESMLLGIREEESLCDSWRNLTINALDEEELEFNRGVSLINGSFQAN